MSDTGPMVGGADTPTQLNEDLQDLVPEPQWDEAYRIVHAIIGDVLDSVRLALEDEGCVSIDSVVGVVQDYIVNNYGQP